MKEAGQEINKHMKTIGLIGGMSWESSKLYYEFLNTKANEVLGGSHSAKCIMVSVDFADIERLTFKEDWNAIGELMKKAAQQLERAGADIILLCTNTIHLVSHYISENVGVPFLHIAATTGRSIKKVGLQKIALLGTKFTMEKDFYTKTLINDFGLEILIPKTKNRQLIHNIIYNELVQGQFTVVSKQKIIDIIKELQNQGAQGVILGCTELPILVSESDVDVPLFDTGKIHAHTAIELSLAIDLNNLSRI
ncbi:aspartate/glutamate racemase family protein [Winogradskyella flava]|nr:aspartate/glutamate racemase family protein [Winogradskyella flava]